MRSPFLVGQRPARRRHRPYWQAHPLRCVCESPVCPFDHVTPMTVREIQRRIGARP